MRDAAYGNALPLLTSGGFRSLKMRSPSDPSTEIDVNTMERVVSPGYFRALGLRVVSGRPLSDIDTMSAPQAIVVSRSFAAKYLGDAPVEAVVPNLGMCRGDHDRWQVVGVVDDMRQGAASDSPQAELFLPTQQVGCSNAVANAIVVIRTFTDPSAYAAIVRDALRQEAPTLALDSMMSMEDRVMTSLARPKTFAMSIVVTAVALAACLVPARRAAQVDPLQALRAN